MKNRKRLGFTLIEMLVAIAIMGILVGSGIAAYRSFNDKQRVLSAGREFVQILRLAQKKAKAGEKPAAGCGTLSSYRVTANASSVLVYALCNGGSQVIPDLNSGKNFETDLVFQQAATYQFAVLNGGITGPATLQFGNASKMYEILVGSSGSIDGREL